MSGTKGANEMQETKTPRPTQVMRGRPVTNAEALDAAQVLIDAAFNNKGGEFARPRFSIPVQPDDTDVLLTDYLLESASRHTSAALPAEHHLRSLLAVIHRDGGHFATEHGLEKASEDAQEIVIADRIAITHLESLPAGEELRTENARLEAQAQRSWEERSLYLGHLRNLLARIHRDGGHYVEAHGLDKAVEDAHQVWAELRTKLDEPTNLSRLPDGEAGPAQAEGA